MNCGSRLDIKEIEPARTKTAVRSAVTATKAKIRGPAIAAALLDAVSVEAANISSRSGIMMGTSADLAGLASMCVAAVMAMPV